LAPPQTPEIPTTNARVLSLFWQLATFVTLFIAALYVFRGLLRGKPTEVFPDHLFHILPALGKQAWAKSLPITYPLYHRTVAIVLFLASDKGWPGAQLSAAIVLALAIAARGWLSYPELRGPMPAPAAAVTCFLLAVVMALPAGWRSPSDLSRIGPKVWWRDFPSIYEGTINPNVWHNPTTIFAAPFALLLFRLALMYLQAPGIGKALAVAIASSLCALAKPNYLLAFLPCFGLACIVRSARLVRAGQLPVWLLVAHLLAAFALPIATLAWQFHTAFGSDSSVIFKPFAVWSASLDPPRSGQPSHIRPLILAQRVPRALLLGLAFPCTVAACFPRQLRRDPRAVFAWFVLTVAVVEYALLAQSGIEFLSGNFLWALIPASYILFLESCRVAGGQALGSRTVLCFGVLALHVASGVICLMRTLSDPVHSLVF
jgi:hypothetical protein